MSDERADAIPGCPQHPEIPQAAVDAAVAYSAHPVDDDGHTDCYYRGMLAAAAPHMAGSGEAETVARIVARLREYGWSPMDGHTFADVIDREFGAAQPDAERAPQGQGR